MQDINLIDSTELETEDAGADQEDTSMENTEIISTETEAGEISGTSGTDIEAAVYAAMDSYFAENVILVSDTGDEPGIYKNVSDFSLTEACLVLIVLILLGWSILKMIGGKVWSTL